MLQECPESPYFARDDFSTEEDEARNLVLAFFERARFGSHTPLREATPSCEVSFLSSRSKSEEPIKSLNEDGEPQLLAQEQQFADAAPASNDSRIEQELQIEEEVKQLP